MTALPSTDSLRCFVAGAKLLHFRAAARSVALTPAAFGQRVRQLEEGLGAKLFERTTRSVRLTEAGLSLLPLAERCLSAAAECLRVGRGEAGLAAVDLVVGTRHELGMSWLLPQVGPLERMFPWLSLHLYFGSGADLMLRVRTLEIDCAITSSRLTDGKLDSIRLHREDYVLVAAPKLLRATPFTRAAHATAHTLLDTSAELPLFGYLRDTPTGGEIKFGRVVRLGTIAAIRERVAQAAGVAVLPAYLVAPDLAAKRMVRVLPSYELGADYFRLVFRRDDTRRALYERLADALLQKALC
jgi:DNA-binding transcriptional LysR family regulator